MAKLTYLQAALPLHHAQLSPGSLFTEVASRLEIRWCVPPCAAGEDYGTPAM